MERITPENEALVKFMDMDGDPNEGHHDELAPEDDAPVAKPTGKLAEGDLEPETMVDLTGDAGPKDPEETPEAPAPEQPAGEPEPEPEPAPEQAAAEPEDVGQDGKKITPWQRANQAKREAAEARRLLEEEKTARQAAEQRLLQAE